MNGVSALSTLRNTEAAIRQVVGKVEEGLEGEPADLAFVFTSSHHADSLDKIGRALKDKSLCRHVLGCTGESIVGETDEIEGSVALSVWAIKLPGVRLTMRRLTIDQNVVLGLPATMSARPPETEPPLLIVLGDPFSFPADPFLKALQSTGAKTQVVGGMASASHLPGGNRLLFDDEVYNDGAVAVELDGPIRYKTVVSQGCRPIGRSLIVTKVERNVIRELGRRPALQVLRELFDELPPDDQERVQEGLHIGRVINEYQESFGRGDFLVRNVMGADDTGGIAVSDLIKVGQTVQFHVRDASTADLDLRGLLETAGTSDPVRGALLFTCNGRGTRLFEEPNHDVGLIHEVFGPVPVAGFFAMGELGPIGGQNFVHGFTASILLFLDGFSPGKS